MHNNSKNNNAKRYATAAIILFGGAALGTSYFAPHDYQNYGVPFMHNGQQYYIKDDSMRAIYPSLDECKQDVPPEKQFECEPVENYNSNYSKGYWYGPVYSHSDDGKYRPSSQYKTEKADANNVGKKLPSSANTSGFGSSGKQQTGSTGG